MISILVPSGGTWKMAVGVSGSLERASLSMWVTGLLDLLLNHYSSELRGISLKPHLKGWRKGYIKYIKGF